MFRMFIALPPVLRCASIVVISFLLPIKGSGQERQSTSRALPQWLEESDLSDLPRHDPSSAGSPDSEPQGSAPNPAGSPRSPVLSHPVLQRSPSRVMLQLGAGFGVRIDQNLEFQQERTAPVYTEATAGYFLGRPLARDQQPRSAAASTPLHGVALSFATTMQDDGVDVETGNQWVLTPSYVARLGFGGAVPSVVLGFRCGIPLSVSPEFSPGLELGVNGAYMFLSGLGLYGEVAGSAFLGGGDADRETTLHPLVSFEAGLYVEYELLP
ncbi:MAG: hypothetical protein AAF355_02900 [Myxococcota bacterium]